MLMLVVCSDSWQSKSMGDQGRKIRKKHELVVQPMGTVCNMSGNWKPVSAFSNMIADRRQCQPNASPGVIETH